MPTDLKSANRYGSICAEIYDIDKPFGKLPDTAFYIELLKDIEGPILEPACGSGRTMVPLLQAGHDVTGFDPSPQMLTRCKARCAEAGFAPLVEQARYEDFSFDTRFAAIIVPVGSFTLIDDAATALAVLARFRDHLRPGGLLAIDMMTLNYLREGPDDIRSWLAPGGDLLRCEGRRVDTDWVTQRKRVDYRYERWRDGALVESELDQMAQRVWSVTEFELALRMSGFVDTRVCANYQRDRAPKRGDVTVTFVAARG